jgi:hypothetical protein
MNKMSKKAAKEQVQKMQVLLSEFDISIEALKMEQKYSTYVTFSNGVSLYVFDPGKEANNRALYYEVGYYLGTSETTEEFIVEIGTNDFLKAVQSIIVLPMMWEVQCILETDVKELL